jgi:hypothetical protein
MYDMLYSTGTVHMVWWTIIQNQWMAQEKMTVCFFMGTFTWGYIADFEGTFVQSLLSPTPILYYT